MPGMKKSEGLKMKPKAVGLLNRLERDVVNGYGERVGKAELE